MQKFYITTPIFYINDTPHIGHAYTMFLADTAANYYRLRDYDVYFLTGTDENSQKTLERAKKDNITPYDFSEKMASNWFETWKKMNIKFNRFIRTSEKQHSIIVQNIFKKIYDNGDIYKNIYKGLYCTGCEEFKTQKDLIDEKICPLHKKECKEICEENYFFKLSKYKKKILNHIKNNPEFIIPEEKKNEILSMLESESLQDISISRQNNNWGIPVPFDDSQTIYVWFDALINYLSGIDYPNEKYKIFWPETRHLIGKDISKFHCIMWPSILIAAGIKLPKSIFIHGFFTIEGEKMSKSLNNAINPLKITDKYGANSLRYYLLSDISFGNDGNFSIKRFFERINNDLSDNFGNALRRVCVLAKKNNIEINLVQKKFNEILKNHPEYQNLMDCFNFCGAISYIRENGTSINQLISIEKPWELKNKKEIENILIDKAAKLYELSFLLEPFFPEESKKAQNILTGNLDLEDSILFPKIEMSAT